jgi:hypothetical protein
MFVFRESCKGDSRIGPPDLIFNPPACLCHGASARRANVPQVFYFDKNIPKRLYSLTMVLYKRLVEVESEQILWRM